MLKDAILIAGPTASGKSAMALDFACREGGVIVNTDSMQVYSILLRLTARPDSQALTAAPHRLYGHVHPGEAYSTGKWLRDIEVLLRSEEMTGKPLIFVGGTGLYFRALLEGLAPIPDIPPEIRAHLRSRMAEEGPEALHQALSRVDPESAGRIRSSDRQRIVRALEVFEASGRPIGEWQAKRTRPLVDADHARKIVVEPRRELLVQRIEDRFECMIEEGAMEEVEALLRLNLSAELPAMKAIGVWELAAVLDGNLTMNEAIARAKAATRQYAKRQMTWFRHQLGSDWQRMEA